MANRIRLYPWELESMPEYSSTLPTGTTLWKMWKRNLNETYNHAAALACKPLKPVVWWIGQYVPHTGKLPDRIGIRWFEVQLLEGPEPSGYVPPDWSNYDRWKRERDAERRAA
jgi:hypothetical protein